MIENNLKVIITSYYILLYNYQVIFRKLIASNNERVESRGRRREGKRLLAIASSMYAMYKEKRNDGAIKADVFVIA